MQLFLPLGLFLHGSLLLLFLLSLGSLAFLCLLLFCRGLLSLLLFLLLQAFLLLGGLALVFLLLLLNFLLLHLGLLTGVYLGLFGGSHRVGISLACPLGSHLLFLQHLTLLVGGKTYLNREGVDGGLSAQPGGVGTVDDRCYPWQRHKGR